MSCFQIDSASTSNNETTEMMIEETPESILDPSMSKEN